MAAVAVALGGVIPCFSAQNTASPPKDTVADAGTETSRFHDLVRDDFFAGLRGDHEAFERAMKLCQETLGKNPQHAQAMVWHGSGLLFLSGQAFQANDIAKGLDRWQDGLKEMDDAVALEPDNLAVLIPRGASLLAASRYDPDPAAAKELLKTGVADYEKVLQLQKPYFQELSVHDKGELLSGLADGWYRLGDLNKSRAYWQQITKDCARSAYAQRASQWLKTRDDAALQQKSKNLSCIGCHTGR